MQIPSLTNIVTHIQNPNKQLGVLIEEIPSDVGRSYQGYKRGGIIEGAERLRKELMAAAIWLFGIPIIKAGGDKLFEHIFKVPMNVDFSNAKDGNDAIGDTLRYILKGDNSKGLDVSGLSPKYIEKFKGIDSSDIAALSKKIYTGKKITSIVAIIANSVLMGIALPKFNQWLTKKKLAKQNKDKFAPKFETMNEFMEGTQKKKSSPSFTGFFSDVAKYGATYAIGYNTENNNTFRLISTDIPMISGRVITSRNKYEGIENGFMDTTSIFFYNFCTPVVQMLLRKVSAIFTKNGKIPDIQPKVSDYISSLPKEHIQNALDKLKENKGTGKISELFNAETVKTIYKEGTYGKYGKINKFVKNSDLKTIDKNVIDFLNYVKGILKEGDDIESAIKGIAKKVNRINAGFLATGLLTSIIGLSYIVPKLTFFITKKISGKNTFPGITKYDDDKKRKKEA